MAVKKTIQSNNFKLFISRYWQIGLLIAVVIAFWWPIFYNNGFFSDDWSFINSFKDNGLNVGFVFKAFNEHFMPFFKIFYYTIFRIFGLSFPPYMVILLIIHILNVVLFYLISKLVFKKQKTLPLLLSMAFGVSSVYFDVMRWFTLTQISLAFLFMLAACYFLHLYIEKRGKQFYWLSIISSFLSPLNFAFGTFTFIFMAAYYYLIIKKAVKISRFKEDLKILVPYLVLWLVYILAYYFAAHSLISTRAALKDTANLYNLNILHAIGYFLLCIFAFISRTIGIDTKFFPNIWISLVIVVFILNLLFLMYLLILYFLLNKRQDRIRLINNWKLALFSLIGILISYGVLAITRPFGGGVAYFIGGKYHLFPAFFIYLLIGETIVSIRLILQKIFDKKKLMKYLYFLFFLYLIIHMGVIIQKSASSFRLG